MFHPDPTHQPGPTVTIDFEGTQFSVPAGITVAAAVMSYTRATFIRRSPVTHQPRAPYCFMGVCHECLMEIDGLPNQQACIIEVKEGMKINRQTGLLRNEVQIICPL